MVAPTKYAGCGSDMNIGEDEISFANAKQSAKPRDKTREYVGDTKKKRMK